MSVWLPRLECTECGAHAHVQRSGDIVCCTCGRQFPKHDGVFRFLTASRLAALDPFLRQYRLVREREGYRVATPEYYRMLPCVAPTDPHVFEWAVRRESYQNLVRSMLPGPLRILDAGAGNGWLSHRLALGGHRVVAVDCLDDPDDGLGACRHYPASFPRVQADFDALPFGPFEFDLVVFNGSLHYSADVAATLARAQRMLARGGMLAVMDSPMFHSEADGHAMVVEKLRTFKTEYGLSAIVHPNVGFFTFTWLAQAFERIGLRGRFVPSRGPLAWRVRREIARIRLRRAPAAFGVWIACSAKPLV